MSIDPRRLLAALSAEHLISGNELALRLGVTRAAVWKQIRALRELGAPIEATAGSGYRLAWPVELLDAARIRAALDAGLRRQLAALEVHWQTDSTNSELQRHAMPGRGLRVCLAETQTAGRGRRGRVWQSPLGGNLYFSASYRFEQGMGALAGLSLVAGLAVVNALADVGVAGLGLKWPNDVLAGQGKLAGILVELDGEFLGPCHAVIGIGVNLRLPTAARARIDQPSIDTASLPGGGGLSRNVLAARLIAHLMQTLERFAARGFADFAEDYARYDLLRGRKVDVRSGAQTRSGIALGVDARGALLVRHGDTLARHDSAEISVRTA